jgi:hypothetical protein
MTEKIVLGMVQWYITHTCNLSCAHCLSYNNYRFHGHFDWDRTRARAEQWSQLIDIEDLTVIGGEPLLHPQIDTWVSGVRALFPNVVDFKICTNGTPLKHMDRAQIRKWFDMGVIIEIQCHSLAIWTQIRDLIRDLYWFGTVELVDSADPALLHRSEQLVMVNGRVAAMIMLTDRFVRNSVKSHNKRLEFYDNDPHSAHAGCYIRDCHYMIDGLLYKCGPVAAGRDLAKQLPVEDCAAQLFNAYKPIDPFDSDVHSRLSSLSSHIDQCRLCPVFGDIDQETLIELEPNKTKLKL